MLFEGRASNWALTKLEIEKLGIEAEDDDEIIGQFGTRTIWHRGQFGTTDNLAPDNLAPRTIWHRGQFGTTDNLAP